MVLRYMRELGPITAWEAMRDLGCTRLAARIYDLRRAGVNIVEKWEKSKNRFGETVQFKRYSVGQITQGELL